MRVQDLFVCIQALDLSGLWVDVQNARIFFNSDEAIVINLKVRGRYFVADLFTNTLDLVNIKGVLKELFDLTGVKGNLRDIDLKAGGFWDRPWLTGRFVAERVEQNTFTLKECRVRVDLSFVHYISSWETRGIMDLGEGWLQGPAVRIDLRPSRLSFKGRISKPELDINASARVARTKIDIAVHGNRDNPTLQLSSDDPYPKEQLLLMLATGRRWSGMAGALNSQKMTPQLTSNFVEYLLFGGSRGKVVEWFGLSDIGLIAEEKAQGISLVKDVSDKLGLGYGVKVQSKPPGAGQSRDITQSIESDYRITDHLTVSARKEIKDAPKGNGASDYFENLPDNRFLLRYRSRF